MKTQFQTLNELIAVFRNITARHRQLNSLFIGDDWEIGASEALIHTVLTINPIAGTLPNNGNRYSTYTVDFNVKCFDLVDKDEVNENEVQSDTFEILKDVVNELDTHPFFIESDLSITGDIALTPFTEAFDSEVSGWECTITLMSPNRRSFCGNPLNQLEGFNFVPQFVTVTDGQNPNSPIQLGLGSEYTCIVGDVIIPEGIVYERFYHNNAKISTDLYDEPWLIMNGWLTGSTPTNPLYVQALDPGDNTGQTLLHDNAFGNRMRFTNSDGTQSPNNGTTYTIDNLSGLAFSTVLFVDSWNDTFGAGGRIENINTANTEGFNDWFCATSAIIWRMSENDPGSSMSLYNKASNHWNTSTSLSENPTLQLYFNGFARFFNQSKTTNRPFLITRIHFK